MPNFEKKNTLARMGTKRNNLRQHFSGAAKPDYFLSVISEQVNFILKKKGSPPPLRKSNGPCLKTNDK